MTIAYSLGLDSGPPIAPQSYLLRASHLEQYLSLAVVQHTIDSFVRFRFVLTLFPNHGWSVLHHQARKHSCDLDFRELMFRAMLRSMGPREVDTSDRLDRGGGGVEKGRVSWLPSAWDPTSRVQFSKLNACRRV